MEIEGLSVVCAGLGHADEDDNGRRTGYVASDNCLENLKDLQRFLRRDHPQTRDVFKQLGKWKTVPQDLIPIIEACRDEPDLVINAVKVIVFLTMPIDPSSDDIPQQMEYLWSFKASFSRNDAIAVIVSLLEEPLEHLECETFTEDDWKVIQLVLTLFRNLLAIQDASPQQITARSTSQFLSLRDDFLEHLFRENVMDLLLALTQHVAGSHGLLKQDNLLLLETFHYIFWGQRPELVATVQQKDFKKDNKMQSSSGVLRSMIEEEEEQRRMLRLRYLPRHSQFCGTFIRLAPDGSKRIVKSNPFITPAESILKTHQIKRGPVKRIACDTSIPESSKDNVLGLLQNFADQFLAVGYNVLMQSVREDIRREHPAIQTSDVIVFFQVAHFFTAYQRCRVSKRKEKCTEGENNKCDDSDTLFQGLICGPIASTMNEAMFNMVISKWHYSFEALKETNDLKSLTTAGALIKEMIHMLDLVLKISRDGSKETEQEARMARILLYKVFYDHTERGISHFLLNLIKSFDIQKQPRSHLVDLVEMTHIVLRLMEALKEVDGTLRVLKKSRKGRKKKKLDGDQMEQFPVQSEDHQGLQDATGNTNRKSHDSNEKETDGVNSELHLDGVNQCEDMFEDNSDGKAQCNSFLENVDECEEDEVECMEENHGNGPKNSLDDGEGNSEDDDHAGRVEVDFDIPKFISSFADNTVVRNYCWLLKFYKSNSAATNHYIIRMLQRICDDCMLAPMLYQLSLLCTFYEILSDQKTLQAEEYKNIVAFLTKLLRTLFNKLKAQPLLFIEILFWKTRRECNYISTDQLLFEANKWKNTEGSSKQSSVADSLGDDEAKGTNKWNSKEFSLKRNIADALGDDEADAVPMDTFDQYEKESLTKDKTRRSPKKRKSLIFNDEQEAQIKELFEQYKGNRRCSHLIAEVLDPDGKFTAAQVSRKLKQLGLKVDSSRRKSGVADLFNGEDDETAAGLEHDVLDKPPSAEYNRTTSRKRQILDSENESEDETLMNHLLKASSNGKSPIKEKEKRVPKKRKSFVFSEEQEARIKELFEQFKDNRKCSHLIAEALDLSAAQVSRKLKLLGLKVTSRKRKSGVADLLSDKGEETAVEVEDKEESDDETLMTHLLRSKDKNPEGTQQASDANLKAKTIQLSDNESDDEVIKDLLLRNRLGKHRGKGGKGEEVDGILTHNPDKVDHAQVNITDVSELEIGMRSGITETDPAVGSLNNLTDNRSAVEDNGVEVMAVLPQTDKRKRHGIRQAMAEEEGSLDINNKEFVEELTALEDDMEEKSSKGEGELREGDGKDNDSPKNQEFDTELLEEHRTSLSNRARRKMNMIIEDDD